MKLSEAVRTGSTFRGESHAGPFVRIANTEELRSDVWGAACEAVYSLIAKRNWNKANKLAYDSDIEALREIQHKYFGEYFKMPVTCPGANPRRYTQAGGRFTGRMVKGVNEFAVEREKLKLIGALTSACPSITNLAELIEHLFYVHNWTREQCADAVEWYEQRSAGLIKQNFEHYQDLAVMQRTNAKLTAAARARERQRKARHGFYSLS